MENKKPFYGRIYIHKNKLNDKCYVGLTAKKDIARERWGEGKGYSRQTKFYNAIIKYGWDNFEHIILPTVYETIEALNQAEVDIIAELDSCYNGYNSNIGGGSMIGYITSDETKVKQSKSQKGRIISEETRAKLSAAHTGKKLSEEQKAKIGKSLIGKTKGKTISCETRAKLSDAHKGKKLSEDHKAQISKSLVGNQYNVGKAPWNKGISTGPLSEEHKINMSKSIAGKKVSEETKEKMRKSKLGTVPWNKGKQLSAEHVARVVEAKRLNKLAENN